MGRQSFSSLRARVSQSIKRQLLDRVPPEELMLALARRTRVRGIVVDGENGYCAGGVADFSIAGAYARHGSWAKRTLTLVQAFMSDRPSGVFIDVGANIGLTSIPIARLGVEVHAFEPAPDNFRFLCMNAEANGVRHSMHLHNTACGDRGGVMQMELSPHNHGDHRLRIDNKIGLQGEDTWGVVDVRIGRLDDFIAIEENRPVAIKIDVQGAEPLVALGAEKILAGAELAIVEFTPYAMRRMGIDPQPLLRFVSGCREVRLAEREDACVSEGMAGSQAADRLAAFMAENSIRPYGGYLDIIARP